MSTAHQTFMEELEERELGCALADDLVQPQRVRTAKPAATADVPRAVVLMEQAAAALRMYLGRCGLQGYEVFYESRTDLYDIDLHLGRLGEADAGWEAMPAFSQNGQLVAVSCDGEGPLWPQGFLHLRHHGVVVARWYWMDAGARSNLRTLWLYAAESFEHYRRLRSKLNDARRVRGEVVWQVVRGFAHMDGARIPRSAAAAESLILSAELRRRVESDLVRFFTDEVKAMYRQLGVSYRRGVLLHGPPGNGKTSLVRLLGARLPKVPGLVLRPAAVFDSDALEEVIRRWKQMAPCVLVIEDLNWLLKQVNVSTFLNLLDGIEIDNSSGLLLIATTNHPDQLDPAINNRPGRFDVVIEVPCPDEAMRLAFLRAKLPGMDPAAIDAAARDSCRLSFAHLQEVLRTSGLLALETGRQQRSADDLQRAVELVRSSADEARDGFRPKLEVPFGLQRRRKVLP